MDDESSAGGGWEDEDRASEARRFSALLSLLRERVPEVRTWQLDAAFGEESEISALGLDAWLLVNQYLYDAHDVPVDVDGVWPRLLAVVEVALELGDHLLAVGREDDAVAVGSFAYAGIICDITRTAASLESLLPWMGPTCVSAAREEVSSHASSRGFDIDDVDWSAGGTNACPAGVSFHDLVPMPRD